MRNVQIVATIGPASKDLVMLEKMLKAGTNVARLNFSWGTYEEHDILIKNIRQASLNVGVKIPIIQDLSGPRVQETDGHEFDKTSIKVITEKDLKDLEFGLKENIDYVALSFVGKKEDVLDLRKEMERLGKVVPIIAKIERKVAIDNVEEIIGVADAVMVARGDLGNEVPLEQIPFIQKDLIAKCKKAGKPVIVATQMMLSMTEKKVPTRAEMTDVAFAVLSGTDAVMLSEETANGKHPLEAVIMMEKQILEAEKHLTDFKINNL